MTKLVATSVLQNTKRVLRMAETGVISKFLIWLGIPLMGISTWFDNLDHIKATILFFVGTVMTIIGFIFRIRKWKRDEKSENIRIEREQMELEERRLGIAQRKDEINRRH